MSGMCAVSGAASTLLGGFGRTSVWMGSVGYGLTNFVSGPQSFGQAPFGHALFNLALTAIGVPLMAEGLFSFANSHFQTQCTDPKTQEAAKPFFS